MSLPLKKFDSPRGVEKDYPSDSYVKVTSILSIPPVRIPIKEYATVKEAYEDVFTCAKVYRKFIEEGMLHPETEVIVGEDDKDNYTLVIIGPELEESTWYSKRVMNHKFKKFEKKFDIQNLTDKIIDELDELTTPHYEATLRNLSSDGIMWDMKLPQNWGLDKNTLQPYVHDVHIVKMWGFNDGYRIILELARRMEIC